MREALENLVATYPALKDRIFDGDELPQFLNVFIDGSDVRLLGGLDTELGENATVILLPPSRAAKPSGETRKPGANRGPENRGQVTPENDWARGAKLALAAGKKAGSDTGTKV